VGTQQYRRGAGLERLRAALGLPEPVVDPALTSEVRRRSAVATAHAERVYDHVNAHTSEPVHDDADEDVA
jgi:hypothetical protein